MHSLRTGKKTVMGKLTFSLSINVNTVMTLYIFVCKRKDVSLFNLIILQLLY